MTAQEGNVGEETLSCPTDSSTGCSRPKMLTQILFEVLNVVHDFVDRMYYRKACTTERHVQLSLKNARADESFLSFMDISSAFVCLTANV